MDLLNIKYSSSWATTQRSMHDQVHNYKGSEYNSRMHSI